MLRNTKVDPRVEDLGIASGKQSARIVTAETMRSTGASRSGRQALGSVGRLLDGQLYVSGACSQGTDCQVAAWHPNAENVTGKLTHCCTGVERP